MSGYKVSACSLLAWQADYDYPDLMDSFPSNHKKGYKKRQTKSVAEEEEEEEENLDEMQEFSALPYNHDSEDPDPEFDPKVQFPLPKEVMHLLCPQLASTPLPVSSCHTAACQ